MPSGIILDKGLPDIDGLEVLNQLKYNLKTRHIPVQIISASEKEKCKLLVNGAIGHLMKPIKEEQLDDILARVSEINKKNIHNILHIEDNKATVHSVKKIIEDNKINITSVGTGEKGYKEILTHKYDCIILDLILPDISGFDVLERVHNDTKKKLPPIIVFTGKDLTLKEQNKLDKYSSDVIIKGVNSDKRLLDEVTLFLHSSDLKNEKKEAIGIFHDNNKMLKDRKVLLVDDDIRNTYAISKSLIDIGLEVKIAKNGKQAIDILNKDKSFEIVLMDIMMPVMDGYEAMKQIRKMKNYKKVTIIALTAKVMPEDRQKCIDAGASEYITKPIDFEKLLSVMRVWLFKK